MHSQSSSPWKIGVSDFSTTEPLLNAERIVANGIDFIEAGLAKAAAMPDADFDAAVARIHEAGISVPSMNWFLPPSLKVTGPDADDAASRRFLKLALGRAARLGARAVVFGSPGSRSIPEGFPADEARSQMIGFCRLGADVIHEAGLDMRIAVEHVNHTETNFINTFAQALDIVREIDRPEIGLAADFYHFAMENESTEILREAGDLVCAVQLADPDGRGFPKEGVEVPGLPRFLELLAEIGYSGGVSIEAIPGDDLDAACRSAAAYFAQLS